MIFQVVIFGLIMFWRQKSRP